jgi:hypothetical protein
VQGERPVTRRLTQAHLPIAPPSAAAAAAAAEAPLYDEFVEIETDKLAVYQAAQVVGSRLEKAPDSVTGCDKETRKLGSEAVCCWRQDPLCGGGQAKVDSDSAHLFPCKCCRFYFHHMCAINLGSCEADSVCGRVVAQGGMPACRG